MGKPRLIIVIRHAQSEGNKNRDIHQTVPDHRVKLTPEGWKQAEDAGRKLRSLLRPSDTLHFFTSPYRRARETTEGILSSLTSSNPTPTPFPRENIKVYEEPRLREQDFGNFQPCSAEMTRMWQERADYGHFFYRIQNGESAADAYDRVSGFNESLWRGFGEEDFASVCVLVTHGLMTRVFLMKWYHFSVEYFEDLRNVNHCEFVVMRLQPDSGKYVLQNKLRTWSELREEREHQDRKRDGSPTVPVRKKWGGCPDGCDHAGEERERKRAAKRQNTADLFIDDGAAAMEEVEATLQRKGSVRSVVGVGGLQNGAEDASRGRVFPTPSHDGIRDEEGQAKATENSSDGPAPAVSHEEGNGATSPSTSPPPPRRPAKLSSDIHSPDRLEILRTGRDGGGSRSGVVSREGSADSDYREPEANAANATRRYPRSMALALNGGFDGVESGMRTGVRADALGDQSDVDDEEDELVQEEREDKSVEGSVY